jgi:hypothetical protein
VIAGIGGLLISLPYFVSKLMHAAIRQAATMANRPGSGILRAVTVTELSIFFLGSSALLSY